MISTVVSPNKRPMSLFDQVGQTRAGRPLRAKISRQFFEHDTRKNSTAFYKDLTTPTQLRTRCRTKQSSGHSFLSHNNRNDNDVDSSPNYLQENIPTNHHRLHNSETSPDNVNQKLRRKLLKVQRKLRMQTEVLKLHHQHQKDQQQHPVIPTHTQTPTGHSCCCSCVNGHMSMMHVHNQEPAAIEMTVGDGMHCVGSLDNVERIYYGSRTGMESDEAYHQFRSMHGMRSVVRYYIRRSRHIVVILIIQFINF